jgi:hypothetical protein
MSTLHFRRSGDSYFHGHPFNNLFSLALSFILALLAVLMLAVSAR